MCSNKLLLQILSDFIRLAPFFSEQIKKPILPQLLVFCPIILRIVHSQILCPHEEIDFCFFLDEKSVYVSRTLLRDFNIKLNYIPNNRYIFENLCLDFEELFRFILKK